MPASPKFLPEAGKFLSGSKTEMLKQIINLVKWINPLSLVLGFVVGFTLENFLKMPRLAVSGSESGGGPSPGYYSNLIKIRNKPGFFGINIGHTVLFGKYMHRDFKMAFLSTDLLHLNVLHIFRTRKLESI